MRRILLTLAILAMAACKHEAVVDLYTADIFAVANGATGLTTTASLFINAGSKAACAEHSQSIATALADRFTAPEFLGCVERGMDSFGEFRVKIDIAPVDSPNATGLYVGVEKRDSMTVAVLQIAPGAYDAIVAAMPDRVRTSITGPQEIGARVNVRNNGSEPVIYTITGTFRDGQPVAVYTQFELSPRSEVKLALSDVSNAALAKGAAPIMILMP